MKAIVQDRYGSADVLRLRDVDMPVAGDDQVLLRVLAAGVDPGVWHLMTGLPYLVRLMGYGLRKPRVRIPGRDFAGRVEAVGRAVNEFRPGDEVFGACAGAYAEYACARERTLVPKPANLTFEQAAAVPSSGLSALRAVRDLAEVRPGQEVLIIGAAGGVGTFAVQIARFFGSAVTGVCSTTKTDLVLSIGAKRAIDYTRDDFTDGRERYDVILDTAGNRPLSRLRRALAPRGTLVLIGGEEGGRWFGGMERQLQSLLLSPFTRQRLRSLFPAGGREDLRFLKELIEAGKIKPIVDNLRPLSETPEAIRHLKQGRVRGKVVITLP